MSAREWEVEGTGGNCTALVLDAGFGRQWLIVTEAEGIAPETDSEACRLYLVGPDGDGQEVPVATGTAPVLREWACAGSK